ncbi:hypothetical protein DEIGR_100894 [Deinococcus grandis]|uniref:Uncharacterized protein n=1 Tax=Deinococcus grandis TaxID=57498 RepID=A0A117DN14_9DEIO|nr:hypothetical protein [Deinococcus grandis]BBN95645.1 hypothetical protein DEGR_23780 [Deinococcus grandis]GAQ20867.1 hypothetical protein DEIGR_100894 [Deinococcus grandis]
MKKMLLTVAAALSLAATATAFAASPANVYATDGDGNQFDGLYTESSWMAIEVPLADLGDRVPSDLSIAVSGLPAGTYVTLDSVSTQGSYALLHVSVTRDSTASNVNSLAQIAVNSGSTTLTTVQLPVYGAAYGE